MNLAMLVAFIYALQSDFNNSGIHKGLVVERGKTDCLHKVEKSMTESNKNPRWNN